MSIVARFFPNGEFSQGVDTSRQRRDKQCRHRDRTDKNWKQRRDEYLQWKTSFQEKGADPHQLPLGTKLRSRSGYLYTLTASSVDSCTLTWQDNVGYTYVHTLLQSFPRIAFDWGLTPLVHQMVESCEKPESRKKLPCMTKNMARNIRNAVYLLEQQPGGKDVLSFLTLTLPGLSQESLASCCANWDRIVKRFFDWLRKHLERYNMQLQHVYCTEIQTKRLEKRHEFAPHLHVVFRGRHGVKKPWLVTPKQVRKTWSRCISAFIDEPFDSRSLENLQRIKYSAARYLSKYLSKSTRPLSQESKELASSAFKTQWGGMARSLSRHVRQSIQRFTTLGNFRPIILYMLSNMDFLVKEGFIRYFRRGFIELPTCSATGAERGLHVLAGCLSQPAYVGGLSRLFEFCELQLISSGV